MSDDEIDAGIRRIAGILAARGESAGPLLERLRLAAGDAEKALRIQLRTQPATPEAWAKFQMLQGAFEALNREYLRMVDLFYPTPPRRPLPPSEV